MKFSPQVVIATAILAVSAISAPVFAQATLTSTQVLTLTADGDGGFGAHVEKVFGAATTGKTFTDKFTFTLGSSFDTSATLTSAYLKSSNNVKDLTISSYDLYMYNTTSHSYVVAFAGVNNTVGKEDHWAIDGTNLQSGNYYLQVSGKVMGNKGGTYSGDMTLLPVPEPETYGMMLAGLGLLGFMARRKRAA